MSVEANKRMIRETMNAFWRGDVEDALANFAEDATWLIGSGPDGLEGKDAIREFRARGFRNVFKTLEQSEVGLFGEGDTVVIEVLAKGEFLTGEPYENRLCHVWEISGGKIQSCRQYVDTEKAKSIARAWETLATAGR